MAATGHAVSAGAERAPARDASTTDRKAGATRAHGQGAGSSRVTSSGPGRVAAQSDGERAGPSAAALPDWLRRIHPATWLLALFLLFVPAFANDFIQLQVFGWAFVLGMIALSLMFLAGYGGMVSLVQMTVAACAGYMYAIFGHSAFMEVSLGWPWWATIPSPWSSRWHSERYRERSRCGPRGSTRS